MRPNANDDPAAFTKKPRYFPVSLSIADYLCFPVFYIGKRTPIAPAATMPETPIDKDSDAPFSKNKVGFSEKILISPPAFDVVCSKQLGQSHFC